VLNINRLFFEDVTFTDETRCGIKAALESFNALQSFINLDTTNHAWDIVVMNKKKQWY
jgi:hypothetical protein